MLTLRRRLLLLFFHKSCRIPYKTQTGIPLYFRVQIWNCRCDSSTRLSFKIEAMLTTASIRRTRGLDSQKAYKTKLVHQGWAQPPLQQALRQHHETPSLMAHTDYCFGSVIDLICLLCMYILSSYHLRVQNEGKVEIFHSN